ncbi:MAG TPA: hypothetical protein VFD92_04830 [Candidatus Binatia bacterium]|nr:hypothetical protein [Candidatus Binatia bacterium]
MRVVELEGKFYRVRRPSTEPTTCIEVTPHEDFGNGPITYLHSPEAARELWEMLGAVPGEGR